MASRSFAYDHPAYLARHGAQVNCPAVAVATPAGKFIAFADMKVKAIRGRVNIAGTNAGGLYVLNAIQGTVTTAISTATMSTIAAGGAVAVVLASDVALSQGDYIDFVTGAANSATMAASFTVEHVLNAGANVTA